MRTLLILCVFLISCGSPEVVPETIAVSPAEIGSAYFENEVAADSKFKGKRLALTGLVAEIEDRDTTLHISIPSVRGFTVRCFFADRNQSPKIETLRVGDPVSLSGENVGLNGRYIELKNCQL